MRGPGVLLKEGIFSIIVICSFSMITIVNFGLIEWSKNQILNEIICAFVSEGLHKINHHILHKKCICKHKYIHTKNLLRSVHDLDPSDEFELRFPELCSCRVEPSLELKSIWIFFLIYSIFSSRFFSMASQPKNQSFKEKKVLLNTKKTKKKEWKWKGNKEKQIQILKNASFSIFELK